MKRDEIQIGSVAKIRSGLVLARKQAREITEHKYTQLTLRAIRTDGSIDMQQVETYYAKENIKEEYLTQPGDIVVRMSTPYTAVLIDDTTQGVLVSSNFIIIRAERNRIMPDYLHWLLNTAAMKQKVHQNATSNALGSVKAGFYTEFPIDFPTMEGQREISELHGLAQKEIAVLHELAEKKRHLYDQALQQLNERYTRN